MAAPPRRRASRPPRLPSFLLRRTARYQETFSLIGDFDEEFLERCVESGPARAHLWYWLQALRCLPVLFRDLLIWRTTMFRNYLKVAVRNLIRSKGFSLINLAGLAVGMACCILILLFVRSELSYDRYHDNADRIWRVTREWFNQDGASSLHLGHIAPPIGPLLANEFPDIREMVRIMSTDVLVGFKERHFMLDRVLFADENFFRVFSFPLLEGDPETALHEPYTLVITPEVSRRFFGDANPVGQVLRFDRQIDGKITGVAAPAPDNSHFHYDMIVSLKTLLEIYGRREFESWSSNNYATYLLMPPEYPIARLREQLPAFLVRHLGEIAGRRNRLHLQPLTDIHLRSHLDSELEANSDIAYVYIFSAVAIFILLIACINFMNLSTARSSARAREVGLRKVVGADRGDLIRQFIGESMLLAMAALGLAVAIVLLTRPAFSAFTARTLDMNVLRNPGLLLGLAGIALFVGVAAGSYPAFVLAAFRPANVLRGSRGSQAHGAWFRTVLVVGQFAVSIILIVCVGVVSRQLHYTRTKRLGFDKERIVVLTADDAMRSRYDAVREELLAHPGVAAVAASRRVPSGRLLDSMGTRVVTGTNAEPVDFRVAFVSVDEAFFETYGMEMAAGRTFSKQFPTDARDAFIFNETAVRKLGWTPGDAVGRSIEYGRRKGTVVGVVKDFHFESLHQEIAPIIFFIRPDDYRMISVRLRPGDIPGTMAFLKQRWTEWRPDIPFQYSFLDERFDSLYRSEVKLGRVFSGFSLLAIGIACLGLLGLASFTAEKRTKEIGVRKVLGASVPRLVFMITRDFSRWVLLANLIAWPAAYFVMNGWLRNFAYRITLGPGLFLAAGGIALGAALLTVAWQAMRAALGDPVDALRCE